MAGASLWFHLEPSSPIPIYVQLTEQVKRAVAGGSLLPGTQLPSVRELAVRLRINPNTVARAYMELERDGVVVTQKGRGTFIAEGIRVLTEAERMKDVADSLEKVLEKARDYGIDQGKLRNLFEGMMTRLFTGRSGGPGGFDVV